MPRMSSAAPSGAGCAIALPILCAVFGLATVAAQDNPKEEKPAVAQRQGNLMTKEREKAFRNLLPKIDDKQIQEILDDPNTIYYTDTEIPKAYQDFDGSLQGIHDPANNISAVRTEPHGNGNIEFPWGKPFGTHSAKTSKSFRFINLPTDKDGKRIPIVWWRQNPYYWENVARQATNGYAWTFPAGTVVGEVLYQDDSKGYSHAYEVRIRRRAIDRWTVNVYRPFPTAKDLSTAVKATWSDYSDRKDLVALIKHLNAPLDGDVHTLADNHPTSVAFKESRKIDVLPAIPEADAIKLLDNTPFKTSLGLDWKEGKDAPHAPTTKADFHIVPKDYAGGFVAVDSKSCLKCHQTCNQHVREFDAARDWYGRIRGSDGIFTFHPFDPTCISPDGNPREVKINEDLVRKGILAQYEPRTHPNALYRRISLLKEEAMTPPK